MHFLHLIRLNISIQNDIECGGIGCHATFFFTTEIAQNIVKQRGRFESMRG